MLTTPLNIEYYSSQGPTNDGRRKPEVTAPTDVLTSAYGGESFAGTSAAAPHVAGAAAILLSYNSTYSVDDLFTILKDTALDLGEPGPDNLYGYGRIKLTLTQSHENMSVHAASGATQLSLNSPHSAIINSSGDVDYYKFSANSNKTYVIETSGSTDTYLTLYSTDGVTILDEDDDSGEGLNAYLTWTCPSTGTYYVEVSGYDDFETGPYNITIKDLEPDVLLIPIVSTNVTLDGVILHDEWQDATNLTFQTNSIFYIKFYTGENALYYSLNVLEDTTYHALDQIYLYLDTAHDKGSTPDADDYQFYVSRDGDGYVSKYEGGSWTRYDVSWFEWSVVSTSAGWCVEAKIPYNGTIYEGLIQGIRIRHNDFISDYDYYSGIFPFEASAYVPSSWGKAIFVDVADDDDSTSGATQLALNSPHSAIINPPGDVDYYKFSANSNKTYAIETSGSTDTYLTLYSTDGVTVLDEDDDSGDGLNAYLNWTTSDFQLNWLEGWSYRKGHIIQGSQIETVSNYSIGVKVYYYSGVDGVENVLGNTYGSVYLDEKCKNDFNDIRFTSSDGITQLDYWIEEKEESSHAIIWVKVNSIPKDPDTTKIYIYYGNPQASSSDNMNKVFVDSDDFEDTDFSEWRVEKSANDILEPSDDYVKHGNYSLKHDDDGGTDVVRIAKDDRSYSSHSVNVWMYSGIGQQTGNCLVIISDGGLRSVIGEIDSISGSHFSFRESSMAIGAYSPSNVEQTEGWHKVEIQTANDGFRGYIEGVLIFSENSARTIEIVSIGTYWTALGNAAYFDSFYVRQFVDPEPVHGIWENEETYNDSSHRSGIYYIKISGYGDFETGPYNITISRENHAPTTPSNPSPDEGVNHVNTSITLQWSASDPDNDPITFHIYFDTINPPSYVNTSTDTFYTPSGLSAGITYYWKIIADDGVNQTAGSVWNFTTRPADPVIDAPVSTQTVTIDGDISLSAEYLESGKYTYETRDGLVKIFTQMNTEKLFMALDIDDDDISYGDQVFLGFDLDDDDNFNEEDLLILWHGDSHGDPAGGDGPWIGTGIGVGNIPLPDVDHASFFRSGGYQIEFAIPLTYFVQNITGFHIRHSPDTNQGYVWEDPGIDVQAIYDHNASAYGVLNLPGLPPRTFNINITGGDYAVYSAWVGNATYEEFVGWDGIEYYETSDPQLINASRKQSIYNEYYVDWYTINITNRHSVDWIWWPYWFETGHTISDSINVLDGNGTITGDIILQINNVDLDCWVLQYGNYTFMYEKENGILVGVQISEEYEFWNLTLASTNVLDIGMPSRTWGSPIVSFSPGYGAPGAIIVVSGYNFTPMSDVNLYLNGSENGIALISTTTSFNGSFATAFTVPAVSFQEYPIYAIDENNVTISETFKVGIIALIISPTLGYPGTEITLTGVGFTPGWYNATLGNITVIDMGVVSAEETLSDVFIVPSLPPDNYILTVIDGNENELSVMLTILELEIGNWSVELSAEVSGFNASTRFGMKDGSTGSFDASVGDQVLPPGFAGVESYFYYPDNPSSPVDFRKLSTSYHPLEYPSNWTLKVHTFSGTSGNTTLAWNSTDLDGIPSNYSVTLYTPNQDVDLRTTHSYSWDSEEDTSYVFTILVSAEVEFTLELRAGWNMVSLPVVPDDVLAVSVLDGIGFFQLVTWSGSGYYSSDDFLAGRGYWLLVLEDVNITISGTPVESLNLTLSPGWSMVGGTFDEVQAADVFPGFYQLVTWTGSGYIPATVFEPGRGYWALVLAETPIQLPPT